MIRFRMPDGSLTKDEKKKELEKQFHDFVSSEALQEIMSVLGTDLRDFPRIYGKRQKASGGVMETQDMKALPELEQHRYELYPLLQELGFIDINSPFKAGHTRILILGGALGACFDRTRYSARFISEETGYIDALTCFRPINPVERVKAGSTSLTDTEFCALTEAMSEVYELDKSGWKDDFAGDRNLNSISCNRVYDRDGCCAYRLFSAPSSHPQLRRADTGDCLSYYLEQTNPDEKDSILAVTSNRYCNRQFIQIAYKMMKRDCRADFDIIGCRVGEAIVGVESYDPLQYLQDLIGILDWIERFSGQADYSIARGGGDTDWRTVPALSIDKVLWTEDAGIRAEGQLCYDDDNLYVHMRALERNIRAEYSEPLSPVCNDSCLEFFFRIEGEENYFNFEINPNGCMCIQYGKEKRFDIVRENGREYFGVSVNRTGDGWEVFYRIPLEFIRLFHRDFSFDRNIMANMYKCGNKTLNKHFIAWSEIESEIPNFHLPEFFRKMSFE